jgi:NAD-dependent dihydropyrimidine dehydrogenase PreA subunit
MIETKQHKVVKRKIIKIDEDLCTGCGNCVVSCAEGALQIVDGKAKVINEIFCDGLGACIGGCPEGALEIIESEVFEFDEEAVERHLEAVKHNEKIETKKIEPTAGDVVRQCSCPSTQTMIFDQSESKSEISSDISSALCQWPVQMHLINPLAPFFQGADVLLTADCVAYALGSYHKKFLKNKSIAIACPKLDQGKEEYIKKIKSWFENAKINTLTVIMMEVLCCGGLLALAQEAAKQACRKVPIKYVVVGIKGDILKEEWL